MTTNEYQTLHALLAKESSIGINKEVVMEMYSEVLNEYISE